jgi:UPF0755 protein
MKIFLAFVAFSILVVGGFSYFYFNDLMYREVNFPEEVVIEIPHNTSGDKVIEEFNKKGLLLPSVFFKYLLRYYIENENAKLYAGYFKFKGRMTNIEILKTLFDSKKQKNIRITIPEGLTLEEYAEIFETKLKCDSALFIKVASDSNLLKEFEIEAENAMGYIMPNTYDFFVYEKPENIIRKLLKENKEFWDQRRLKKLEEINLTKHQATILASIVEAETPLKSEAKTVAGLYLNRLKKGMLLQADPTIQFMLGKKQRVLYRHLEQEHPYNTYLNPGLPPGPINNPGFRTLEAVLNYERHNYLFMVSIGDGSGRHYFSTNHQDHLTYVNDYRKTRDSIKAEKKMQDTLSLN